MPSENYVDEEEITSSASPPDAADVHTGAIPPALPSEERPERVAALGPMSLSREKWRGLWRWMASNVTMGLERQLDLGRTPENMQLLSQRFAALYQQAGVHLSDAEREELFQQVADEIVGYGPIESLLRDDSISEVMVNGPHQVYVERDGNVALADVHFDDADHMMWVIDRIIRPLGRRVDRKNPMIDVRLPDGSRVNVIIPPGAIDHPTITIRKFGQAKLTLEDLIALGSLTSPMAEFLRACVVARLNIIVSGDAGSGRTTLLNILASYIPEGERIVTVEDSAELQLQQPHVVRLEAQPPDLDGTGEVRVWDLVRNALRMRPDRIVVGEVHGGEVLDMLQAMNTGHDGSMTTVHANSPHDTIARLETMALMSGFGIPLLVMRQQIAAAIDLIVQQARFRDGSRRVVNITEVQGMEGEVVAMQDVFFFHRLGLDEGGNIVGEMRPSGVRPRCTSRLEEAGFHLSPEIFLRGVHLSSWPNPSKHG